MHAAVESAPAHTGVVGARAQARELPSLSLYLHFPWCVRKCPYCDFNSYTLHGALAEAEYLEALLQDLRVQSSAVAARCVQSIFFGGGTPSLFSPAAIERLVQAAQRELTLAADVEVTLEANPGTVERGRFADYRAAGVTRVSLGAQSFSDASLKALGRIHSADETRRAAGELHAAGLTNFNLDLMYGLPGQEVTGALADVEAALELEPRHLSHYQLTLEPGTLFSARPPEGLPPPDVCADIQQLCGVRLADAGLQRYEISAYARAGAQSRHNLNYWRFGDYLGVGAGAHGKATHCGSGELLIARTERPREPRRYLAAVAGGEPAIARQVPGSDRPFEYLMNALRLTEGFEECEFEARTGLEFGPTGEQLQRLLRLGLLERRDRHWRATVRGFDLLNEVLGELLPSS
jgi:putative oxygen-independent coproporphyrinogen III oxidase